MCLKMKANLSWATFISNKKKIYCKNIYTVSTNGYIEHFENPTDKIFNTGSQMNKCMLL